MALLAGGRIGVYEIVAPIGSGGMGDVYRARDPRLGREVAIKILPERFAADGDALARFEREARAVAALSHPNIISVHDVGRDNGITYVVLELLEGETLRARLGALPPSPSQHPEGYAQPVSRAQLRVLGSVSAKRGTWLCRSLTGLRRRMRRGSRIAI